MSDHDDRKRSLDESIRQWEARPQFGALTPEVLGGVPDDLLEQAIVDFVHNFRVGPNDRLVRLLRGLPAGFPTVYTTWALDAEIANGGFHQYFWNTDGAFIDMVQQSLERLGARAHLEAFAGAAQHSAGHPTPDVAALAPRAQLEAFSESALAGRFDELDARWNELGDLAAARVKFIRENPTLLIARLPLLPRLRLWATRARSRP